MTKNELKRLRAVNLNLPIVHFLINARAVFHYQGKKSLNELFASDKLVYGYGANKTKIYASMISVRFYKRTRSKKAGTQLGSITVFINNKYVSAKVSPKVYEYTPR